MLVLNLPIRIYLQGRDPTIAILVELALQLNGVRGDKGGRLMPAASVCVCATKDQGSALEGAQVP